VEKAPALGAAPLPGPQVLAIEDQGSKGGVYTSPGSLAPGGVSPKASSRKTKSRKKSLGEALRLARKKQSLPPSGVVTTLPPSGVVTMGVPSLPPPGDSSESRGVERVHPQAGEAASTGGYDVGASRPAPEPMGGDGADFVGTKSGDRAPGDLAPLDVLYTGPDSWEKSGLCGPLAVPTARLADASSGLSGLDLGEPVTSSRPTGKNSDAHRPPGTLELNCAAVQSEFRDLVCPPGLARTQELGLRTRDLGPVNLVALRCALGSRTRPALLGWLGPWSALLGWPGPRTWVFGPGTWYPGT